MSRLDSFLAMGGYAQYVWPAYGVALLILGALMVLAVLRYRKAVKALELLQQGNPPAGEDME